MQVKTILKFVEELVEFKRRDDYKVLETLNLVELLHNDCELRWCMQLWDSQPSEVNGYIQLYRPRAPKPELDISNARFPILGLLDAFHQEFEF